MDVISCEIFEKSVEGVNFALGFEQVRVVKRDGGLLADAFKKEQILFVEWRAARFVHELDDAEHFVFFTQRGCHPGLNLKFSALFHPLCEARLLRGHFHELWIAALRNFAEQAFGDGDGGLFAYGGIFSGGVCEMEFIARCEPEIAGACAENVFDFSGDDWKQLFEFESGSESAAEIVQRGEAFESGELCVALAFDCAEVRESLPDEAAGLLEKMGVFRREFAGALVQNLDNAFGAVSAR